MNSGSEIISEASAAMTASPPEKLRMLRAKSARIASGLSRSISAAGVNP